MTSNRRSFIDIALVISSTVAVFNGVTAESHTISFNNKCGFGTPMLIQGPKTLSTGAPFTSNGPFTSAIAYLQTGKCLFNGENCLLAEMTLNNPNPNIPGSGSSVDISMIAPHKFSVPTSFEFTNGCAGTGASCDNENCPMAFRVPDDNQVQVACQANNVNLVITFCGDQSPAPATVKPAPATVKPPAAPQTTATKKAANTSVRQPLSSNTPPANPQALPPPVNTPAPAAQTTPLVQTTPVQSTKVVPSVSPNRQPACRSKRRFARSGSL